MTKRAARGLAAAIDNLGTEHRQFHQPDRRLARILREVCRSEWPATPPCLDAAELCGIWRVLAGIDARVTLARYSESSRFPHEHQRLIAKALDAFPHPISIIQRRYLCGWAAENQDKLRIEYQDRSNPWLSFPSVRGWTVIAPVSLRPRTIACQAFACRMTNLGIHFYTEPLSEKNLRRFMR
mgnify:CR=1 FL=1